VMNADDSSSRRWLRGYCVDCLCQIWVMVGVHGGLGTFSILHNFCTAVHFYHFTPKAAHFYPSPTPHPMPSRADADPCIVP
jgi:hypothetical protein